MSRVLPLIAAAALAFSPAAFAQTPKAACGAEGQTQCAQKKSQNDTKRTETKRTETKRTETKREATPKVGQSARSGKPYQRSANSRFPDPPSGQEYRVVDDNIVLSETKSKKIVKVLGPRASLEK